MNTERPLCTQGLFLVVHRLCCRGGGQGQAAFDAETACYLLKCPVGGRGDVDLSIEILLLTAQSYDLSGT